MGRIHYKRGLGSIFHSQPVERTSKTKPPVKLASLGDGYGGNPLYRQKQEWERVMREARRNKEQK